MLKSYLLYILAAISAIGGPVMNSILPSTDVCKWLRYLWPTSEAEVNAVQDFFVAKVRRLHQVCAVGLVWENGLVLKSIIFPESRCSLLSATIPASVSFAIDLSVSPNANIDKFNLQRLKKNGTKYKA